jgi:hypothetical protein
VYASRTARCQLRVAAQAHPRRARFVTYADCCEDILQLVHEGDQARVVDVDAVTLLAFHPRPHPQMPLEHRTYALGLVAMAGEGERWFGERSQCAHERGYVGREKLCVRAPMAGVFGNLGVQMRVA